MEDKTMKWETLDSKYLFKKAWLTARQDKIRMPNGKMINEYYVLEYPDWINVIAETADGKMIIEQQWRQAVAEVSTEICAGVIEKGEDPLTAAKRELQEETGYAGGTWTELMTIAPNSSTNTNHCHCFLAQGVEKVSGQHLDETEDIRVMFKSKEEVFTMLQRGDFHQATMLASLWKYFYEHPIKP